MHTLTKSEELWAEHQGHLLQSIRQEDKCKAVYIDLQCGPKTGRHVVIVAA